MVENLTQEYKIYVEIYGKLARGEPADVHGIREEFQMAISIASQDIFIKIPLRSQSEFTEELKKLTK